LCSTRKSGVSSHCSNMLLMCSRYGFANYLPWMVARNVLPLELFYIELDFLVLPTLVSVCVLSYSYSEKRHLIIEPSEHAHSVVMKLNFCSWIYVHYVCYLNIPAMVCTLLLFLSHFFLFHDRCLLYMWDKCFKLIYTYIYVMKIPLLRNRDTDSLTLWRVSEPHSPKCHVIFAVWW
jgi:hypothetical protein